MISIPVTSAIAASNSSFYFWMAFYFANSSLYSCRKVSLIFSSICSFSWFCNYCIIWSLLFSSSFRFRSSSFLAASSFCLRASYCSLANAFACSYAASCCFFRSSSSWAFLMADSCFSLRILSSAACWSFKTSAYLASLFSFAIWVILASSCKKPVSLYSVIDWLSSKFWVSDVTMDCFSCGMLSFGAALLNGLAGLLF